MAPVRYPVVLFDLDGTLIDSGAIIVASMRHAATTVLGREIPDEELTAAVGGPRPDRPDARARRGARRRAGPRLPRAQRAAARRARGVRRASRTRCARCSDEGRRLGIVTAKRHATVAPRLRRPSAARGLLRRRRRRRRHGAPQAAIPTRSCWRSTGSTRRLSEAAYVGDSPFDVAAAKAAGVAAIAVAWGGIHRAERLARERARRARPHAPRSSLASSEVTTTRIDELRALRRAATGTRTTFSTSPRSPTPSTTGSSTSSSSSSATCPRATFRRTRRRDASARRPRSGSEGRPPVADGVARQGHDRRGGSRSGPKTSASASAPTSRSPTSPSRRSTASPSASSTRTGVFVRGATRGDGERGRGRDRQPADDRGDPAPLLLGGRRGAAGGRRGARRGLHALSGFRELNERLVGRGEEDGAEPAQRRGRVGPAEEPATSHAEHAALDLGLRRGPSRGRPLRAQWEMLEWLRERGFRTNPFAERHESIEDVARVCREWEQRRIELDYEIDGHRDQGRLVRPAAPARRAPRPAALGARVQVGADDGADEARSRSTSASAAPARSTPGRSSSRSRSAASPSRTRRSTTRRTSTARTSARATP